jgi:hypothetical protein
MNFLSQLNTIDTHIITRITLIETSAYILLMLASWFWTKQRINDSKIRAIYRNGFWKDITLLFMPFAFLMQLLRYKNYSSISPFEKFTFYTIIFTFCLYLVLSVACILNLIKHFRQVRSGETVSYDTISVL